MPIPVHEAFPDAVLNDRDVLYHGTSNVSERRIDNEGFVPVCDPAVAEIMLALDRIRLEVLHNRFPNAPQGGFEILPFYTGEQRDHGIRPIALSHTFDRCKLYASQDFSGGEAVRTMARIRPYLHALLNDPAAREARQAAIEQELSRLPQNIHPSYFDIRHLDVDVLRRRVEAIDERLAAIVGLREGYRYGVVYALRIDGHVPMDRLRGHNIDIQSLAPIPPAAIIGKVVLEVIPEGSWEEMHEDAFLERLLWWRGRLHTA